MGADLRGRLVTSSIRSLGPVFSRTISLRADISRRRDLFLRFHDRLRAQLITVLPGIGVAGAITAMIRSIMRRLSLPLRV
jgi:hypothetical protein